MKSSMHMQTNERAGVLPLILLAGALLVLNSCTVQESGRRIQPAACYVIFDAGSSGTRLNIYQRSSAGWLRHAGPITAALADPVRGIRGKSMRDAPRVTDGIVALLDAIRRAGPVTEDGVSQWSAFDWQSQCLVKTLAVYATAGMRLAEQKNPTNTRAVWALLNRKLAAKTGLQANTRTLSGFEEGLYAWLAVRVTQADDHFGSVEMGGASAQVTFPCAACTQSVPVRVSGRRVPMFSHSFPGLGQDEAWKQFGTRAACQRGAGLRDIHWRAAQCTAGIELADGVVIAANAVTASSHALRWYLGEALRYLQAADVDSYCRGDKDTGFEPEKACFRTLYQLYFLRNLGIPETAVRSDADWTLGAVICAATKCLKQQP